FDTKIAAQLCGRRKFGLGNLLADEFGIISNKRFQTTNWMKRPLPPGALEYAVGDTAHLHRLKERLAGELAKLKRTAWAQEEFEYALRLSGEPDRNEDTPAHQRMKRSTLLTGQQLAVLEALYEFRDRLARSLNRPQHYVLRNDSLLQMAAAEKLDLKQLQELRGVHPALKRPQNLKELLAAWRQGQSASAQTHFTRRNRTRAAPDSKKRLKDMQLWRMKVAAELDLEPYLILANDVLVWCANNSGKPMDTSTAGMVRHWQRAICWPRFEEAFGTPAPQA
ncbi:MAG: HRDC domain-containing protein, partial [Lentisphaerae bacterium]|nr:HRDC domain-containing protein [Lentisphaerota bacterium]